eukprot:400875-Pelagomonas_calceolata.AAC.2
MFPACHPTKVSMRFFTSREGFLLRFRRDAGLLPHSSLPVFLIPQVSVKVPGGNHADSSALHHVHKPNPEIKLHHTKTWF